MKPHVQHETDWDAPEARNLSLPNGGYREIRGTRLLWHAYEDVLHNGSWSHHDLVNMAKAEQIASGVDFSTAFQMVVSYRSADVRLWREALIERNLDILSAAGYKFRIAFRSSI